MNAKDINQINARNVQLTNLLVKRVNPHHTVKIIKETFSGHDAEIYDGDMLVCYLETKVRDRASIGLDSALIDEFKGNYLKKKSINAPCFVAQFYTGDNTVHLYKFANEGAISPDVIIDSKDCPKTSYFGGGRAIKTVYLLPFDSKDNWTAQWREEWSTPVSMGELKQQGLMSA